MKGFTIIIMGCIYSLALQAQPSVQPLIQAEKDFEQLSHKEGLKKAFVFFADSAGLAFPDSGAANAQTFWTARGGTGFFSGHHPMPKYRTAAIRVIQPVLHSFAANHCRIPCRTPASTPPYGKRIKRVTGNT